MRSARVAGSGRVLLAAVRLLDRVRAGGTSLVRATDFVRCAVGIKTTDRASVDSGVRFDFVPAVAGGYVVGSLTNRTGSGNGAVVRRTQAGTLVLAIVEELDIHGEVIAC
jgi:hypothetical protein